MGNRPPSHTDLNRDDELDDYVLVDARAVILDLPDDVRGPAGARLPLRAAHSEGEAGSRCRSFVLRGDVRQRLIADARSSASMWERLGRTIQRVWPASKRL